ncbi:beta-fructofuranosidase, insoluble isoenzyme CWINV1-like protein, partial [Tanacetum coccineum]
MDDEELIQDGTVDDADLGQDDAMDAKNMTHDDAAPNQDRSSRSINHSCGFLLQQRSRVLADRKHIKEICLLTYKTEGCKNTPLGPKRQQFYRARHTVTSSHKVYSQMKILSIIRISVDKQFGYGYFKEIVVRRACQQEYLFKEAYSPKLYLNDIEDMYLLYAPNKLHHLKGDKALRLFIRRIVLKKRVEDHGKLSDKAQYHNATSQMNDELYKFGDATLKKVCDILDSMMYNFKLGYNNQDMPNRAWSEKDQKWTTSILKKIDETLLERRIMRSLESFIGHVSYNILIKKKLKDKWRKERSPPYTLGRIRVNTNAIRITQLIAGIEDSHHGSNDAMHNPPSYSDFSQKKFVSLTNGNPSSVNIKQHCVLLILNQTLSWNSFQGGSSKLNLSDHRFAKVYKAFSSEVHAFRLVFSGWGVKSLSTYPMTVGSLEKKVIHGTSEPTMSWLKRFLFALRCDLAKTSLRKPALLICTCAKVQQYLPKGKYCCNNHEYYVLGMYDPKMDLLVVVGDDFTVSNTRFQYDYGRFYVSKSFYDTAKQIRELWGWVNESDRESHARKKGWSGLQSFPRSILLSDDKKQLVQWPVKKIEKLRAKKVYIANHELKGGTQIEVPNITASHADVEVSFSILNMKEAEFLDSENFDPKLLCAQKNAPVSGSFGPFGFLVLASKNLTEHTAKSMKVSMELCLIWTLFIQDFTKKL